MWEFVDEFQPVSRGSSLVDGMKAVVSGRAFPSFSPLPLYVNFRFLVKGGCTDWEWFSEGRGEFSGGTRYAICRLFSKFIS